MNIGDLVFDETYSMSGIVINIHETERKEEKLRLFIILYDDGVLGNGWERDLKLVNRCRRSR